jgi:predicted membrane GTPase involved in stress response
VCAITDSTVGWRPPADGTTTLHALGELQVRGTLFIGTHSATYNGMIIGESARESDMEVRTLLR